MKKIDRLEFYVIIWEENVSINIQEGKKLKTLKFKKIVSIVMAVCIVLTLFSAVPFSASAETTSGTTGECTWTLDGAHLTISGNGKMGGLLVERQCAVGK